MRYLHHVIMGLGFALSSSAQALDFYAEALYWKPSESVDWALTNSNISSTVEANQVIAYQTIDFNASPGYRLGFGFEKADFLTRFMYTRLHTDTRAYIEGNVISTFMPSKFSNKFYGAADVDFSIDLDMGDFSLSKVVNIDERTVVQPFAGLRAGAIRQEVNTRYKNPINLPPATFDPRNVLEHVTNRFTGVGPILGFESKYCFFQKDSSQWGLFADILGSYLWGTWSIHDTLYADDGSIAGSLDVGKRDFGAFAVQGFFGVQGTYRQFTFKAGYEVSDWFDQYQVFDNGSGTHTNDLVFQGATIAIRYRA